MRLSPLKTVQPLMILALAAALFMPLELKRRSSHRLDEQICELYHAQKRGSIQTKPLAQTSSLPQQRGPVTYGLSGGRLGDNLLSYLHARWISYRDHVPLVFKPFPEADAFSLAHEAHESSTTAFEIPYFPEPSMKNRDALFAVDWDDPGFRSEIARCLYPTQKHTLLQLPQDRITVCVHVRRGGSFDALQTHFDQPLKFPPDSYYFEQIRRLARIFQGKKLYVFLMTDDLDPKGMLTRYKRAVGLPQIEWDCRTEPPENPLDDFFSIPQFNCLIHCDSNFSIVASKLTRHAIRIAPTHYWKKEGAIPKEERRAPHCLTSLLPVWPTHYWKKHAKIRITDIEFSVN